MKNAKLFLVLFTMFAMIFVAACGSNNVVSNNGDKKETNTGGNTAANTPKEETPEPRGPIDIEIMFPLKTPEVPDDKIELMIEELTGYNITYQWVPDASYEERLNTAYATGSLPQAVYQKNANTFPLFKEAMADGQFWEIGPYISEFENLSRLKSTILDNTKVKGKLYTLYLGRPLSKQGLIYRKDWADHLGLSAPTNVEELTEMLRAFTEDDPDNNGKDDTIGLADRGDFVYGAFKTSSSWFGTPNNWGEKDGQLLPEFMFDGYIDTMDWIKQLRDNGYINKDFPVTSKQDQQNMFENGTAGVYIGGMTDVNGLDRRVKGVNPDAVTDVAADLGEGNWAIPGYGNVVMFPKSAIADEDELRDVLGFFDKTMTEEVANLMRWGIEGEHYDIVDGLAHRDPDKYPTELTDRFVKGYTDQLIGEHETNLSLFPKHELKPRIKAEELIIELEKTLIHDPVVTLDSPTALESSGRLQEFINDASYRYMLGDIDKAGFEAAIEDWKNQGGQDMIDEYNADWKK